MRRQYANAWESVLEMFYKTVIVPVDLSLEVTSSGKCSLTHQVGYETPVPGTMAPHAFCSLVTLY